MQSLLCRPVPSPAPRAILARPLPARSPATSDPRCSGRASTRTATTLLQVAVPVRPSPAQVPKRELHVGCRARPQGALATSLPPVLALPTRLLRPGPGSTRREHALSPRPLRFLLASRERTRGRSRASQSATLPLLPLPASGGSSRGETLPPP